MNKMRGAAAIRPGTGSVYFIEFTCAWSRHRGVKVGVTGDLPRRLNALRYRFDTTKFLAAVPGDPALEGRVIRALAGSRYVTRRAKELFRRTPEVLAIVAAAKRGREALEAACP